MNFALITPRLLAAWLGAASLVAAADPASSPDLWRAEHRLIDLHQHINMTTQHVTRAVKIMDAAGLGVAVNLGTGTVTRGANGEPSEFERGKALTDILFPGRFLHSMVLDYRRWNEPDFGEQAARQIEEGHRLGSAGFKEFKRLGLGLRDGQGKLIRVDDPKLDPVWRKCGELGMPVSIHVADPKAFWLPFDARNERWDELKDHKSWWFGDTNKYPAWKELLEQLIRVVARHPKTTFVSVHFGNNAEELDWVDEQLSRYPNLMVDLAARIPEIGRRDPEKVRALFIKHQDRILFGTDFMVYDRLILGSSGNTPPPTDDDAQVFYQKHWRWLETRDRDWPHMTPIQGNWTISAIGLPPEVLRKIYFDNARQLLIRALPLPVLRAAATPADFALDGHLDKPAWQQAEPARMEYVLRHLPAHPEIATTVRSLWTTNFLYFSFDCPYTKLTTFTPASKVERNGLWERDVVEVFLGTDPRNPRRYTEFELAPTNEKLDIALDAPKWDLTWNSGFETAVRVDETAGRWYAELRIPLQALVKTPPAAGTQWRLNLFRSDRAHEAFLAWSTPLANSTHVPERFGTLVFVTK